MFSNMQRGRGGLEKKNTTCKRNMTERVMGRQEQNSRVRVSSGIINTASIAWGENMVRQERNKVRLINTSFALASDQNV